MHCAQERRKNNENEGAKASEIAAIAWKQIGWRKTTTYTMLTRCIGKKYLRREDPSFRCFSAVSREEVSHWETEELLHNNFHDSPDLLVASLVGSKKLSVEQLEKISKTMREMEASK